MPTKTKSTITSKFSDPSKTIVRQNKKSAPPFMNTIDRSIAENIRDGYFETDLSGRITFVNQAMCKIHGYTQKELLRMDGLQFTNKETTQKLQKIFSEARKTGKKADIVDYEITRKDGTKIQIEVSALVKKDEIGRPIGFTGITRDITERKRLEEAIRQSEERYRGAIEQMQDAYYEVDLAGNYTYVNDALCRFYQLPKEQFLGTRISMERQDKENAKKTLDAFKHVYRTGQPLHSLEVEFVEPDGKTIGNYELSVSLIRDAQGAPIGFRGITKRITQRKHMEEELRKSEERYRSILEEMEEGYYEEDLAGNLTFINNALLRSLGYPREEIIQMNYRRYVDKETGHQLRQLYERLYKTGQAFKNVEAVFIAKDGTKRIAEFSGAIIRDKEGRQIGFRGISRDVTLRRKEEDIRRQEAERYRIMLEDIDECYFELDRQGRFTFINDAQCRDLGYSREELLGTDALQYAFKSVQKRTRDIFSTVYKTRQSARYEAEYVTKDGTIYSSEVFVSLMVDPRGNPIGFRGLSRNITERKQAEKEREKLISELQKAVSEVKTLSGMLPICSSCKKIRDDKGYWEQIEKYIAKHSHAAFSHSLCPDCAKKLYPEYYEEET